MKTFKYIIFAQIAILACLLVSCKDEDKITQSTGCSGITKLTSITSTTDFDVALSACNLGEWIVLHGENLCAAQSIIVNGITVNMREVFLEPGKATLQVPRKLATDGPTNAIEVVNEQSSVKLDISINIPDLIVDGLENEYANIGDTVHVVGANFDLYDITDEKGKVYFGEAEAKITATTEKYVSVVVPAGAIENAKVKVVGEKATKTASGQYKDSRGLFEGFEGGFGWAGTDPMVTDGSKPGDIKACNGKYLHIVKNVEGDWYAFIANGYNWPKEMYENPQDWCMRFEIATITSMTKKIMQNDLTKFQWKPWGTTEFTTYSKWKTITFNMKDVLNGMSPDPANAILFQMSLNGAPEFVDMCIDNFRVLPKD